MGTALAHEIPRDVTVEVRLAWEGERLVALFRAPLAAMRDIDFATRGAGYLDPGRITPQLEDAARLWLLDDFALFQDGRPLGQGTLEAVRAALPGSRPPADFGAAREAVRSSPLAETTSLYWEQAVMEAVVVYPLQTAAGEFEVLPTFARLGQRTLTRIRYQGPDGEERVFAFSGDPGRMSLDPGIPEVLGRFIADGFGHVLDGVDHLLFLFALVIPLARIRPLVVVVTAFTLAHSITLAASMLDLVPSALWFPALVEMLIAASILYMAVENLLPWLPGRLAEGVRAGELHRRWLTAFAFGLVHGFGFSFALKDMLQFAGDHLAVSLLGFNLGIEAGQILVLLLLVPLLRLAGRWAAPAALAIVLSVVVAHTAWHWLVERWSVLVSYTFTPPAWDLALLLGGMRWLMLVLVAVLVVWLVRTPFERWARRSGGN